MAIAQQELPDLSGKTDKVIMFVGPCSIESEEQFAQAAECFHDMGLSWIRGGTFKPRTNPHSFQGLGLAGVKIMHDVCAHYHLKSLTEVLDTEMCETVAKQVNGLQIGARNFQNFSLLRRMGKVAAEHNSLVMFKRGFAGTIDEWLAATSYITNEGAKNVMLCERGLRTFETATRFTLDISAVPVLHKLSTFPVCVDVSHAAGQRDLVPSLAKAALAAGADAIMIEVHPNPHVALSDSAQQLTLEQFKRLFDELSGIAHALGKTLV